MLKVDVAFARAVTPGLEERWYPGLLPGFGPVRLACYPKETAIAEKLATAVEFGRDNNRVRDYWDLHAMSERHAFAGDCLAGAVAATFATREAGKFVGRDDGYWAGAFRPEFATPAMGKLWRSWTRSHVPACDAEFPEILGSVIRFAMPVLHAVRQGGRLPGHWQPGAGWSRGPRAADVRRFSAL